MIQLNKVIKIAFGSTISILLATFFGLQYSISAGIITLLTIQDTKKETIFISLKRFIAFIFATTLSIGLFPPLQFSTISFGIFLFIFVGGCYLFKLGDGIAMNAVLATHYILSADLSFSMIGNEAMLLLLGAGVGTLVNLVMPDHVKQIRNDQATIETELRKILFRMAYFLQESDKSKYEPHCFEALQQLIRNGLSHAYTNMNNSLLKESQYYIQYMEMRKQQYSILKEIYEKIVLLKTVPAQAVEVSRFIEEIANTLMESNNAKHLISQEELLHEQLKQNPLPVTREEFEDRAVLYMILVDFKLFLQTKERFADSLTAEQLEKYWSN